MKDFGYTKNEKGLFRKISSPAKVQDFLNSIPFNFDQGSYCMSPRKVLENKKAHCVEGAIFAYAALEQNGFKPKLLDLRSTSKPYDYDHVVCVYEKDGFWGAVSKTNHGVLRYREPVYKNIRELVMSYFHEYFLDTGVKTLREYSTPLDLKKFEKLGWRTSDSDISEITEYLDDVKHYKILTPKQIKNLRNADKIEIEMGKLVECEKE